MRKLKILSPLLVLFMVSCSAMAPRNFDQGWAMAMTAQTSALQTTTTLLQRQQISKKDASTVLEISDQTGKALDSAREMKNVGDMDSANAQLTLATRILDQIHAYLATKGK